MEPIFRAGLRAGILGGGQLARMLAEAGIRMGLRPVVFADSPEAPAARVTSAVVLGKLTDAESLKKFLSSVDIVVFESEFVDTSRLKECVSSEEMFFPKLACIERLRDKLRQKELLKELGIPTAPFVPYTGQPLESWIATVAGRFNDRCVFKWGQLGYDGKGVFVHRRHGMDKDAARIFCEGALRLGVSLFAEEWIDFKRELALVSIASRTQEVKSYPLVLSEQLNSICWRVTGPATGLGVEASLEKKAVEMATRIAKATGIVGTFAIEMFETPEGDLRVNELAPRVHNSGHFTQDGAATSQFENHWRAVLGLPLGSVICAPGFAMLNLIGPEGSARSTAGLKFPEFPAEAHFHWYDKTQVRAGRKMGHLNGWTHRLENLSAVVEKLDGVRTEWEKLMREGT